MLKSLAWKILKGTIVDWLKTRALILPTAKQNQLAMKWHVDPEVVKALNEELAMQAAGAVENLKV